MVSQPDSPLSPSLSHPHLIRYLLLALLPLSLIIYLILAQFVRPAPLQINEISTAVSTPIIIPGSLLDTNIKAENFTDVDRSSWSWKYIQQISPIGIIPPKTPTEFDPQGLVSRLDMARFLLKTYELITKNSPPVVPTTFTDLTDLSQADQDTVAKIYGLKVTAGTSATTFSPSDPVNRAQMVTFLSSLYKAITGEFPPEVDVPFTDIYDPDLDWSVKYIKKTYNLKITAGTSATTFSPRDNVTREQMATFIFSFMRLFGSSYNTNLAAELSGIKSVVLDFWDPDYYKNGYTNYLSSIIPEFKQTGFNTVWLVYPWAAMNPKPLSTPPVYDDAQFTNLINTLEVLKSNQMKAIIGLDYLGKGWSPEGINYCTWTTDLPSYQAFETYVKEFLKRIENYSDVVYILFFNEGAETCSLNSWDPAQAPQVASIIRPTLGSLPQRLDPNLRNKFKIGFHDWTLLSRKMANGESPVQMPLSYDFYSFTMYKGEEKTDQQIGQEFDSQITNIKAMYPFTPVIVGEFGATSCNIKTEYYSWNSSASEQARVLDLGLKKIMDLNLGFNIWDWKGKHFGPNEACPEDRRGEYGITIADTFKDFSTLVSKPARVEIQKLLNPSAPAPMCIEQASPVFAQKIIDPNHKQCSQFSSSCIPQDWSIIDGITDCKQACTGDPVWVRAGPMQGGMCEGLYPSDCIPDWGIIDDTCGLPKVNNGNSWNKVWSDEFNGDKIDETKWQIRGDEAHRDGWWLKEDAYVDTGNLVLRTKYDPTINRYGSGAVDSNGKFEHKYGYYEAKIKFAKKEGHWGAFWLMPKLNIVGNSGTDGTEIDIVEKPWINDHIQQTLHWDGYGAEQKSEANSIDWGGISDGYHYFGLNWQPDEYVFYIDGKESWRTKAGDVSQVPQFIYLTDEVGQWIGNINKVELPDYMYVDYVRVYDLAKKCTGDPVWLRNPQIWGGRCANGNPYPSDCLPNNAPPGSPYTIDDTCRPASSPSPTPLPSPSLPPGCYFAYPPCAMPSCPPDKACIQMIPTCEPVLVCPTPSPTPPINCVSWFDGCNTCMVKDGVIAGCTKIACKSDTIEQSDQTMPRCLAFSNPSPSLPPGCRVIPSPRWCIQRIIGRKCPVETVCPEPTPTPKPSPSPTPSPEICGQATTRAFNPETDECQDFSTTCLPPGWQASTTCRPTKYVIDPIFDGGPTTDLASPLIASPSASSLPTSLLDRAIKIIQVVKEFILNVISPGPK